MSMKSMMMMPPRLRRRSWRAMVCAGFEVGLEDGVVEVAHADEAAGVDVDGGHRLGLVDDQVAAGLEVDAAASAFWISSSTPCRSNSGRSPV
jgi:hypothetical protein